MPAPDSFTPDELTWATRLAARLRLAQATFAEVSAEERRDCLNGEIHRALKEIVTDKRARYLAALEEHFPTFSLSAAPVAATPEDNSPEALVQALVRIAPDLPPGKLAEFGVQLQQAGYIGLKSATLADEPPPEFSKLFGLEPGTHVDIQRLFRLALVMSDFFFRLEVFVWTVWQQVSPQTRIRRESGALNDPRKLSGRYLSGDDEVSAEQIRNVVEKSRQLTAGLLGAIGGAGRTFAARFSAEYAPDNIMALAKTDTELGVGLFGNDDVRGWRKFKKLFQTMSEDAIEEKLHQAIAHNAENLIRGTRTESQIVT